MAEAHPASEAATVVQPGDGSVLPSPWQGDIDALKQEMGDLRTALMKEIEELKKVKMEAVSGGFIPYSPPHSSPIFLPFVENTVDPPRIIPDHRLHLLQHDGA